MEIFRLWNQQPCQPSPCCRQVFGKSEVQIYCIHIGLIILSNKLLVLSLMHSKQYWSWCISNHKWATKFVFYTSGALASTWKILQYLAVILVVIYVIYLNITTQALSTWAPTSSWSSLKNGQVCCKSWPQSAWWSNSLLILTIKDLVVKFILKFDCITAKSKCRVFIVILNVVLYQAIIFSTIG